MFHKKSTKNTVKATKEPKEKKEKKPSALKGLGIKGVFKNRAFLGVVSIILALILSFGAMPAVENYVNKTVMGVALTRDMEKGEQITPEDVKTVELSGNNLQVGTELDKSDVVGSYLIIDMMAEDILVKQKIAKQIPGENPYLTDLPEGKLAISVSVNSLAQGLSSKLRRGDVVRLFYTQDDEMMEALSPLELQYVEVLAVTNEGTTDITDEWTKDAEEATQKSIATVTLLVNHSQAAMLTNLNANCELHFTLVHRGDKETKTALLAEQEKLFASGGEKQESAIIMP